MPSVLSILDANPDWLMVGLFGSIIPNCERLQTIGDEFLESEIETMTGYFPELLAVTRDPTKLRKLVDISCKDL